MISGVYSQNLSTSRTITESQRDSLVSKLYHRKELIDENKVLKTQISKRDSVIVIQKEIIATGINTNTLQKDIISNLKTVINNKDLKIENKDEELTNEKKRGRNKAFSGLLKGTAIGIGLGFLIFN